MAAFNLQSLEDSFVSAVQELEDTVFASWASWAGWWSVLIHNLPSSSWPGIFLHGHVVKLSFKERIQSKNDLMAPSTPFLDK